MRIVLATLIAIHGLIHLFGFLKAYGIYDFRGILQPISKTYGIFWLTGFLLFAVTGILVVARLDGWWFVGFLAVLVSQVLIVRYWSDAGFGTIANVVVLLAALIGYSGFSFQDQIRRERIAMLEESQMQSEVVREGALAGLPPVVQKWLRHSGVVGKQQVSNVYLTQELQLKLKPEQTGWNQGRAEQYFTTLPPAFHWNIDTEMNSVLSVAGRDRFQDGRGEMIIKLLSLLPVADAKDNERVNQATLQRYLAEIVWFPSAALRPYFRWEQVDDSSARATMEYNGTRGSGIFHFDADGNFTRFVAMRYKDAKDAGPSEWTVTAIKTEERNGIRIPVECEASWKLESKDWTWLKLKITDIRYDAKNMPVVNDN